MSEPKDENVIHELHQDAWVKLLEIQWQDHFQTRSQTWKALYFTVLFAASLIAFDWRLNNPTIAILLAALLLTTAQFGIQITLRHRKVEQLKFSNISTIESRLGIPGPDLKPPSPIFWFHIFQVWKINTPLFILRVFFIIQILSILWLLSELNILK